MTSIANLLFEGEAALRSSSPSPRLDATLLLSHTTGFSKLDLISKSMEKLSDKQIQAYRVEIQKRSGGEPVAYIVGKKEFFGRDFFVDSSVLIPRPDTELLVERALEIIVNTPDSTPLKILELGVGSGCIITTLAVESKKLNKKVEFVGIDISSDALKIATRNAQYHGVVESITFLEGDWFSSLPEKKEFAIIISNPPYIAEGDTEVSPETRFEPRTALYAGIEGLDAYRTIAKEFLKYLQSDGVLLLEIGHLQGEALTQIFKSRDAHSSYKIYKDLGGRERVYMVQHA